VLTFLAPTAQPGDSFAAKIVGAPVAQCRTDHDVSAAVSACK
jgi:hypothetical protein